MVYLCGVSIGLLMLGAFNARRTREARVREAEEEARRAAQQEPVPQADSGSPVAPSSNPS